MRNILYIYLVIVIFSLVLGCSDDEVGCPTISFRRPYYILSPTEDLNVEVRLSEATLNNLTVGFTVGGTGKEGEDYIISAKEFMIPAGQDSAIISLSPMNTINEGREVSLYLQEVEGYDFGMYRQTMIPIEQQEPFTTSFFSSDYNLYEESEIAIKLFIGTSEYTRPSYDITVPFDIDPASTAELGVHYEIVGGEKQFLYKKDDLMGRVRLRFLKKEAGKDKIVLRLVEDDRFLISTSNNKANINIDGPIDFENLVGTWRFSGFSSESHVRKMATMFGDTEGLQKLPQGDISDVLVFTTESGKNIIRTNQLVSDLKNYFIDEAEVSVLDIVENQLYELDEWSLHRSVLQTELSKVNLNFSDKNMKESEAEVDFRLLNEGNTLEIRIVQYEPVDFLQEVYSYYSDPNYSGDVNFDKNLPMKGNYTLSFQFSRERN